jgi:ATP-binding cassette, subfamily B, bacterial CvaB/MchF/RaxB
MNVFEHINLSGRRKLPMIFASEAAECGLACIAMIARYHGHDVDLNGLRQRFALSLSGISLRSLMALADQLDFSSRLRRSCSTAKSADPRHPPLGPQPFRRAALGER